MQEEIQEQINHEIVLKIIEIAKGLLGSFNVNTMLNQVADAGSIPEGCDLLIAFGDKIQSQYGDKGAFATMRQLGREVGKNLMANHPAEEWEDLLKTGLLTLGFTKNIKIGENSVEVTDCVYHKILEQRGKKPTEHSFCWMGLGFAEIFIRAFNKNIRSVKWQHRNDNMNCCFYKLEYNS